MATSRTLRYIRINSDNSSVHNGNSGVNSDGDGPSSFQEPTWQAYDRRSLGSGVDWDLSTQKVTLTNSNTDSKNLVIRWTNDSTLGTGSPHYGGSAPTSMLIPYRGIPASRSAAYAQTIAQYVRTFTENTSGSFSYNIAVTLGPGFWNGSPTNINPVTYNFTAINSSGNGGRGEKLVPSRGTLYHSGEDFDFSSGFAPFGVSNIHTFNHYSATGFGFSDFIPTYDSGNAITDGTSFAIIKITTTGSGSYGVTFYANATMEYDHLQPGKNTYLFYQGLNFVMDGSDSDHTIPTFTTTSSLSAACNQHYHIEATNYSTTTSLAEQSVNLKICPTTSLSTTSSLSITPSVKKGISATNYTTQAVMDVTTANFAFASAALTAQSSISVTTLYKPGLEDNFTSSFTTSATPKLILDITGEYMWDSFNLNTYFEENFAVDNFSLAEGEYTWEFLATSAWDDWPVTTWLGDEQSWENWPNDAWASPYQKNASASMSITPSFKLGDTVSYTGSFSLAESVALNQPGAASLLTTVTTDFTAAGRIDVSVALSTGFSPTLTANISYSLSDTPIAITGAFTPVLTANAITDTFADIDVSTSMSITPTFKPSGESNITVSTTTALTTSFKHGLILNLSALASTLTVGKIFFQADPYWSIKVLQETRTLSIATQNRITLIEQENRVNNIITESRTVLVPEETRRLKLRLPQMTSPYTTPRVRSET